ncbi:MAG TPA: prephenate dehydrogenase/arogenate dehydrogenase family protein [bacterium]|nr:prephenate dehydrogenase/arogenate dehydrogenase family protein [bacterium]HOM27741.1 prephenate dehydrogenase/arogenate dehydrogenase family protein [bacterium]
MSEFKNIGIIGLGLIGGSLGLDLKKKKIAEKIIGYSRKKETMEKAVQIRAIDMYCKNPEELIEKVDFLILATPIRTIEEYIKLIKKVKPEIFFTDVASVKKIICEKVKKIIGEKTNFVGSHPISGSEKSGIDFIKEGLFENKTAVITITEETNKIAKEKTKKIWKSLGSKVFEMSPEEHDRILGFTSHLPHFLVYSLLATAQKNKNILKDFFGSGFLDTTRIGKSNPQMWSEIFLYNKKNILLWIKKFEKEMKKLKKLIENNNIEDIKKYLTKSKNFREDLE